MEALAIDNHRPYAITATRTSISWAYWPLTNIECVPQFLPVGDEPRHPFRRPIASLLREQATRERAQQRDARARARRGLHATQGCRRSEVRAALSVRALAMKRAA